jgi:hypothetical protein
MMRQPKTVVVNNSSPTIDNDALGKVIGEYVANAFRQTPIQTNIDAVSVTREIQTPMGITTRTGKIG